MIDANFLSQLQDEPWAILPSAFSRLLEQVSQRADDPVGDKFSGEWIYPQVEMVGPVAIVPCHGVMGRHTGWLAQLFGMADTALMQEQLRNVRDDSDAEIVVLHFRTPGGLAIGLEETAATIRQVSEAGKPVIAYADSMCASAGYFLAAACDTIYADPAATVGSISTIMAGVDSSRAWSEEGLELKLFTTGKFKAIGMPGKTWTDEEEAHVRERLMVYDGQFKNFIRQRRALSDEQMQGQTWQAKEVEGDLVDGFADSLPELVAGLVG